MYQTLPANNLTGISLFNSNNSRRQVQLFLSYDKAEATRGTWWSPSVGRAASVSAEFGKRVGTQRLRPRGAFPTSPALSEGCRLPEHPGLKTGPGPPPLRPRGARRTPSLHPGAGRASSASSPRARGTRAAGGTWGLSCNASSSRSLSTAGMVPRGGAEGRTKARRAGDAAAESARGSGDEADDVLCPGRPRVRPRLASE